MMKSQNLQTLRKVIRSIIVEADDKPDEFGDDPNLYRGPDGRVYRVFRPSDFDKLQFKLPDIKDLTLSDSDLEGEETSVSGFYPRPADEVLANQDKYTLKAISRGFSPKPVPHPTTGRDEPHWGADLNLTGGSANVPVIAIADGTIVEATPKGSTSEGSGNQIKLKLDDGGSVVVYMHLDKINPDITNGTHVTAGREMGSVGSTGRSKGPHLHFQWHTGLPTNSSTAVDPIPKLQEPGKYLFPFAVPVTTTYK